MTSLRLSPLILKIAMLATASLVLGGVVNLLRKEPLPWLYQTKEQRLVAAVIALRPAADRGGEKSQAKELRDKQDYSIPEVTQLVSTQAAVILDARPEVFYNVGHLPGALSLPRDEFAQAYDRIKSRLETNKDQLLILYCSNSSCEDSKLVQRALEQLGYTRVRLFPEGWAGWTRSGHAIEKRREP